ncbi:MAG: hypothetical protein D5R97_06585 [Candidatus Syntrophonatronum acetioxidans]|uniref:Uncharacterized protein n=1 Tax=Candidatus Syntrophonatronum acetioxidans TaxID=1795816 RepID=A0A424YDS3_9FIRM|nr:MAG: hypothetical protein D5R97_06585 [Candidatus Syntrophonatronum acetioxidans]
MTLRYHGSAPRGITRDHGDGSCGSGDRGAKGTVPVARENHQGRHWKNCSLWLARQAVFLI